MKITYYVGGADDLFRIQGTFSSLLVADHYSNKGRNGSLCFVFVDDSLMFVFDYWKRWSAYRNRRGYELSAEKISLMFERWVRLKLRQLQRTQPSA